MWVRRVRPPELGEGPAVSASCPWSGIGPASRPGSTLLSFRHLLPGAPHEPPPPDTRRPELPVHEQICPLCRTRTVTECPSEEVKGDVFRTRLSLDARASADTALARALMGSDTLVDGGGRNDRLLLRDLHVRIPLSVVRRGLTGEPVFNYLRTLRWNWQRTAITKRPGKVPSHGN